MQIAVPDVTCEMMPPPPGGTGAQDAGPGTHLELRNNPRAPGTSPPTCRRTTRGTSELRRGRGGGAKGAGSEGSSRGTSSKCQLATPMLIPTAALWSLNH